MADRIPHDEFVAKLQERKAQEKQAKKRDDLYLAYTKDAVHRMEIRNAKGLKREAKRKRR